MDANNFLFKASQGKKSTLDKAYIKHINKLLIKFDEEEEARWETYGIIIQELINQGKEEYFKEIQYRVTDGENLNKIMLDIIDRESDDEIGLTWLFRKRIEEYIEDDFFKRFYF